MEWMKYRDLEISTRCYTMVRDIVGKFYVVGVFRKSFFNIFIYLNIKWKKPTKKNGKIYEITIFG